MGRSKGRRLSRDTVKRHAEVSRLHLNQDRLTPRIEAFLRDVDKLSEVDVSDVESAVVFPVKRK